MSLGSALHPVKRGAHDKPKRRCITLSLGEKLRLLEKIDAGGRLRNLMAEFGISKTTFYDIQRDKDKLRAYARYQEDPEVINKKRITSAKYEALEQTLYEWYKDKCVAGIKVRGIDIQAAAENLAPQLGITEFKASYGWLRNFQDRYGIKKRKGMREGSSTEVTDAHYYSQRYILTSMEVAFRPSWNHVGWKARRYMETPRKCQRLWSHNNPTKQGYATLWRTVPLIPKGLHKRCGRIILHRQR